MPLRRAAVVAVVAAAAWAAPASSQSTTHYYVYCANNKIEVDTRDGPQMRSARGSGICQMGQFNYRMDAESFAKKNFGGVGGKCACR
ncbi:MAG: hypothetical protein IPK81_10805 [Rhodospirillales bacterium]|nr:hypothetical protein [Rhodospirillales bacterium]QQS14597.1 MAG: hypothetical protein IPK81_10805 [Rhodospirillales bacterium]